MDVRAALTHSVLPSTVSIARAKDLILVNTAINTPTVMLAHIANKKIHGRLPLSATRLTRTSSSAQIRISVAHLLTAGMCLKKTERKMSRNACRSTLRKKVPQWDGSQLIH